MRDLNYQIQKLIIAGKILACIKTKNLPYGRCQVTLGRYQTAVPAPTQKYAMWINGEVRTYSDAHSASTAFIQFVGRDIAFQSYKRAGGKVPAQGGAYV